jgi:hypothetical protein
MYEETRLPTVYIELTQRLIATRPNEVTAALVSAITGGAIRVRQLLIVGLSEADIAITDDIGIAIDLLCDTRNTHVLLIYYSAEDREASLAFAKRLSRRVSAGNIAAVDNEPSAIQQLHTLITDITKKTRGVAHEDSSC